MNMDHETEKIVGVHADELVVGEILGFDAEANAITLRMEDVRAANPVIGGKCVVRVNTL